MLSRGGEQNGRVQFLRGWPKRIARPLHPKVERKLLRLHIIRPCKGKDPPALIARNLGNEVRGRAKAIQTDPCRLPRHTQRPIAYQPGAEQRRCLQIRIVWRNREAKACICHGIGSIPTVQVIAGKAGIGAQILAFTGAVVTHAARPAKPGHAHAIPHVESLYTTSYLPDHADDLMAGNQWQLWPGQFTIYNMQIGPADATGMYLE